MIGRQTGSFCAWFEKYDDLLHIESGALNGSLRVLKNQKKVLIG